MRGLPWVLPASVVFSGTLTEPPHPSALRAATFSREGRRGSLPRHGRPCGDHPRLRPARAELKTWVLGTSPSMTPAENRNASSLLPLREKEEPLPSWSPLWRPSTSSLGAGGAKDVDARDKPEQDDNGEQQRLFPSPARRASPSPKAKGRHCCRPFTIHPEQQSQAA